MKHAVLILAMATAAVSGFVSQAGAEDAIAPVAADAVKAARPHHVFLVGMLRVTQPWVDVAHGTPDETPAYLTVENRGAVPDRLIAATLQGTTAVSIAGSPDGQSITVPPNGRVTLQPGAVHLALRGPLMSAQAAPIPGVLRFERSGMLHLDFATDHAIALQDDQSAPSSEDRSVDLAH